MAPRTNAWLGLLFLVVTGGCELHNPGDEPPRGDLYFPITLALSTQCRSGEVGCQEPKPRLLYVGNNNFDLRYRAGSLQAYDLDAIERAVRGCEADGPCPDGPITRQEPLTIETLGEGVLVDEVLIGTFVTRIKRSASGEALYLVTRTDEALTRVRLDESSVDGDGELFDCGQGAGRRCAGSSLRGVESVRNERDLSWPGEPVDLLVTTGSDWQFNPLPALPPQSEDDAGVEGLADAGAGSDEQAAMASDLGQTDVVLVAHRFGAVSLFVDSGDGPELTHVLSAGFDSDLTGLAYDRHTRTAYLSYNDRSQGGSNKLLFRIGVGLDQASLLGAGASFEDAARAAFVYPRTVLRLSGVSLAADTRALSFVPADPALSHVQGRALVVGRQPQSLLMADVDTVQAQQGIAVVRRIVEVGAGPSRVAHGRVNGRHIAAVTCFNAREVHIVDLSLGRTLSVVSNLSGPFDAVIDGPRQLMYVSDFRSSVIRVVDLRPTLSAEAGEATEARLVGVLGRPKIVQELQ